MSVKRQQIVANNLVHFHMQKDTDVSALTEDERSLLYKSFMNNNRLIPTEAIKRVYEILSKDTRMRGIIFFLYKHNCYVSLDVQKYEELHKDSAEILEYINKIFTLLKEDVSCMRKFIHRWMENGNSIYDLKTLVSKIPDLSYENIKTVFDTKSSYINLIFGNKICNINISDIEAYKEDILIYAIVNNKKSFIRLIEEHTEDFFNISEKSILHYKDFYTKYFNINELTINDLKDLAGMNCYNSNINKLKEQTYTFKELKALLYSGNQYIKLYNNLLDLKIDDRLLIIRQLIKKGLLSNITEDTELEQLAQKLKLKPLYKWLEQDFFHIRGIRAIDAVKMLIIYNEIKRFIPEITSRTEALYIIRNKDALLEYEDLDTVKDSIVNIDNDWPKLVERMEFSKPFIEEHHKQVIDFLLNNGAEIALKYYYGRSNNQKEPFKRIVKAELMGELETLKYFGTDLEKEIEYPLNARQLELWVNNNVISSKDIEIEECDDFYNTMLVGEQPTHTCMSYINGTYNECLLSFFDSNKKILYARLDGQVVGRALVRLTKGKYENEKDSKTSLSFVDLENLPNSNVKNKEVKEHLSLFLERPYIAHVSPEIEQKIKTMFIRLLEKKADDMDAALVLNREYEHCVDEQYLASIYYLYISRSKAGVQYLDSLGGERTVSDEGSYRSSTFFIKKQTVNNVIQIAA